MRNLTAGAEAGDIHFVNAGFDQRMERMFLQLPPVSPGTTSVTLNTSDYTMTAGTPSGQQPVGVGTYDAGYYNVGVRPTSDNLGVGANDPFNKPLSIIKLLQLQNATWVKVPGNALQCGAVAVTNSTGFPLLSGPVSKTENVFVDGLVQDAEPAQRRVDRSVLPQRRQSELDAGRRVLRRRV